jgi:hypothetical protein
VQIAWLLRRSLADFSMNSNSTYSRFGYFGLGPVLVGILFALAITDIFWLPLNRHEKYPDPVVGAITWADFDKSRDMHALLLLVGASAVLVVALSAMAKTMAPEGADSDLGNSINQFLLLSLVPAGYRLAVACMGLPDALPPLRTISVFPLGAIILLIMLRRYQRDLTAGDIFKVGGAVLLIPVMTAFSAMGIMLAIARLVPGAVTRLSPYVSTVATVFVIISVVGIVVIFALSATLAAFRHRVLRCLMYVQYPLVLLLFYLIHPPLIDPAHLLRNPYPTLLVSTLGVLAIGSIYLMYRRFRSTDSTISLSNAIAPVAIAALWIFVLCPTAAAPGISRDYFHTGEQLLPWQQIWHFHSIPYVNFVPIHGLMAISRGAMNQLFFDGSIANYSAAEVLLAGIAAGITALAACELVTPLGALFFLFVILPVFDRMYFTAAALFCVASARLLTQPAKWLGIWLVVGFLSCAYNAALGPAFVLGTVPVALWQAWRGFKLDRFRFGVLIAIVAVLTAVALAIPMIRLIAFGFTKFILDNQWTNEAANGIAWVQGEWKRDQSYGVGSTQVLWESVRFGWIPASIIAAVFFWKQLSKPAAQRNIPAMTLAGSIPLVMMWSSLWVIERLDPATPGRSAALTEVALLYLMPALVLLTVSQKRAGYTVLLLAIFIGLLYPYGLPTGTDPVMLLQKPFGARYIPPSTPIVDGNVAGLPRIGQVVRPSPDFTVDIFNLKKDLSEFLHPGETYLDLSDQTSLYYYLDMQCPAQYAAYVAANSRLQGTMMRQMQQHPVPVVLISPSGWIDAAPVSLRCYRPYRDYVLKYPLVLKDGFIFLVDPSRVPKVGPVGSEDQLEVLDVLFRRQDLQRLPIAWGDSWNSMQDRFTPVAEIPGSKSAGSASGKVFSLNWEIPAQARIGTAADFVRFHFEIEPTDPNAFREARRSIWPGTAASAEPVLSLKWTRQDNSPSEPIVFRGRTGDLLIPLGAYPRWLLGSGFHSLIIDLLNPACAKRIAVSNIQFLQLKPL